MADVGLTPGLDRVTGFFDGLGRVADSVGGIVDTGADIAEDIARGRLALHEEQRLQEQHDLDLFLRREGFQRGDNRLQIIAFTVAGLALVLILTN